MKKLILITGLFISCIEMSLEAQQVDQRDAMLIAKNFYYEKCNHYYNSLLYQDVVIQESHTASQSGEPCYHVFNMSNGGFVIVSAQMNRLPIIGYDFTGRFDYENIPVIEKWSVKHNVSTSISPDPNKILSIWKYYSDMDFQLLPIDKTENTVEPLLTSEWRQTWPYNYYCPVDPIGPGGRAYAGCAAIVLAQIAYYWQWPDHGFDSHCYIPNTNPQYGEQCADYQNTWYRWDEMTDTISDSVNQAIAELFYHAGVSVDMDYTPYGSAPAQGYYAFAHPEYFKFTENQRFYINNIGLSAFREIIRTNLDSKIPVPYAGRNATQTAMHMFICDGYQDSLYFHFNIASNNSTFPDGYFLVDEVYEWNTDQYIYSECMPDTINYDYPLYKEGDYELNSLSGNIRDGSGPIYNYQNDNRITWIIDPEVFMGQVDIIALNFKRFDLHESDMLRIFVGEDTTGILIGEYTGDVLPDDMELCANKLFIEFIADETDNASGFFINYMSFFNPTSINEPENTTFINLSPNPASSEVNIQLDKLPEHNSVLKIYNLQGQLVQKQAINECHINVDVSTFSTGVYIVQLQNRKSLVSKKLMIN